MTERARSFGAAAEVYARMRPTYAVEAVRFALPAVPCAVADVGAGTGKLTEVLLGLGCSVVAVEPDDEMRALIRGAEARAGTAEVLPLGDASVDAVVAGQAYHWFDAPRFVDEAARVLRPGGTVGLLWNEHDDRVQWVAELAELTHPGARYTVEETEAPFADERFHEPAMVDVEHAQRLDVRRLVDLVATTSHVLVMPPEEQAAHLAEVERFARTHFGDAEFELPYVTRTWRYRLR